MNDTDLDDLLAQARSTPPKPSEALMARAMEDALALQPVSAPPSPSPQSSSKFVRLWDWLSSAALPTGLATATLIGVWIGISTADSVSLQAAGLLETDLGMDMLHRFPVISGILGEI